MRDFATETALARVVITWLHDEGWDVWQEVDGRYDIIARTGSRLWAIETKLSFGAPVLAQAWDRRRSADVHWVSVAVPPGPKDWNTCHYLEHTARCDGTGVLRVTPDGVRRDIAPTLTRHMQAPQLHRMLAKLDKCPRDAVEAGTNRGGYWTEFKGTAGRVAAFVRRKPGCTLRELVDSIEHHYGSDSSARTRIGSLAEQGVFKGVRVERDGKRILLFPEAP